MSDENKSEDKEESFISHLEALRKMLIRSILAVVVLSPAGICFAPKIVNSLVKNSLPEKITELHYFSPMEVFITQLKIGLLIGFVLAIPFITNETRKFVFPALYRQERKFVALFASLSFLLFVAGSVLCIFCVLPLLMKFSAGFSTANIQPTVGLGNFINLAIALILAFGIMFQFPLVVILGIKFDLIELKTIKHLRPYVFVGILILAAILTPPDIVSQLILAIPTYLLFEAGLLISAKLKNL